MGCTRQVGLAPAAGSSKTAVMLALLTAHPQLHRDTAAGKALFAIYGGNKESWDAGTSYSARNRRRLAMLRAAGWVPPQVAPPPKAAPPKPKVALPRFGGISPASSSSTPAVAAVPRRRPAAQILSELRAAADEEAASQGPLPSGPLLDDAEKERLALMMQYRGKPPAAAAAAACGVGRSSHRADTYACAEEDESGDLTAGAGTPAAMVRRLQARFEALAREVDEREQWQRAMQLDGLAQPQHAAVIKAEIAARVVEMERVDKQLQQLETKQRGVGTR